MDAVVKLAGVLARASRQVGTSDGTDEERVSGEDEPRVGAATEVGDDEARALGRVAGRVQHLHAGVAELDLGNTRVTVVHTPGHTPESISLVVTDLRRGTDPWFVLTGDTLFVGDVGRPDLPGRARENAGELYDSIHAKLLTLPGDLEVYPGHFSGSVCGAGMSGKPSSTIAFEKRWNPLLAKSRDEFVDALADVPPKPEAMEQILRINQGREEVRS